MSTISQSNAAEVSAGAAQADGKRLKPRSIDWRTLDLRSVDGDPTLRLELLTYQQRLTELLHHKGEFVVIHRDEVISFFPSLVAALEFAAERFDQEPVLVKQIVAREPIHSLGGLAD